jgi:aminoglycoside phosphotransferase (APT) family kinase protein
MINKFHSMGLLPDRDLFYLHHADLQPRNLLFTTPTPTTVRLTGILDWDNTLFAPKFMSTRTPFFL